MSETFHFFILRRYVINIKSVEIAHSTFDLKSVLERNSIVESNFLLLRCCCCCARYYIQELERLE